MARHGIGALQIPGAVLALMACFSLAACKDNAAEKLRAEQIERLRQSEERLQGYETERAQLLAQLGDTKNQALLRLASNKMAAAALAAAGGGTVGALSEELSDEERLAAGAIGAAGVGYCIFNFSECQSLTVDIARFASTIDRLEKQIAALSQTAGYRIHVRNRCAKALTIAIAHNAPVHGPMRFGWWTIEPQATVHLQPVPGIYLRTTGTTVQYDLRTAPAGEDVDDLSSVTMKDAVLTIDASHNAVLETIC